MSDPDESMSTAQAVEWARGYAAKPEKERRREVAALLTRVEQLERSRDRYRAALAEAMRRRGECPPMTTDHHDLVALTFRVAAIPGQLSYMVGTLAQLSEAALALRATPGLASTRPAGLASGRGAGPPWAGMAGDRLLAASRQAEDARRMVAEALDELSTLHVEGERVSR